MKRILFAALLAASLVPASAAFACGKDGKADADCGCKHDKTAASAAKAGASKEGFGMVTVAEVATWSKAGKATVLDANSPETRAKDGIVPGAKVLTSSTGYDVAKELPAAKNTKLVFYCANTRCLASHAAAKRALEAGYTDVNVMPEGIKGWKAAGQPTASIAAPSATPHS